MIESNILKRFLVKLFIDNSRSDLGELASVAMNVLKKRFFPNESITVKSPVGRGKIIGSEKEGFYRVRLDTGEDAVVPHEEICRKYTASYEDIISFLECATVQSPFGRVLIENVFEKIASPAFGIPEAEEKSMGEGHSRRAGKYARAPGFMDIVNGNGTFYERSDAAKYGNIDRTRWMDNERVSARKRIEAGFEAKPLDAARVPARRGLPPQKPGFSVQRLEKLKVAGFEGPLLKTIVKIYMFLGNFKEELKLAEVTLDALKEALMDAEYSSELIFRIHASLLEMVDTDPQMKAEAIEGLFLHVLNKLPGDEKEAPDHEVKKLAKLNPTNWKQQMKQFLHNFSQKCDDGRPLEFLDFGKKDACAIRANLLSFLIDLAMFTDKFRGFVDAQQTELRAIKSTLDEMMTEKKKRKLDTPGEIREFLMDGIKPIIEHPLRANIGRYDNNNLFYMDGSVVLRDGDDFYMLGPENLKGLLDSIDLSSRVGRLTASNLKQVLDCTTWKD